MVEGHGPAVRQVDFQAGRPCPAPSLDNLLVLYVTDRAAYARLNDRMQRHGYQPVERENPY